MCLTIVYGRCLVSMKMRDTYIPMIPRLPSISPPSIHTDTMSDGQPGSATPKNRRWTTR